MGYYIYPTSPPPPPPHHHHHHHHHHAKASRKETKIEEFMHTDTTNVEHKLYDCKSNNWSHRNSRRRFKANLEAIPGKHSTDSLKKTAMLGTSQTRQKAQQF
jgi:hypothetical protein